MNEKEPTKNEFEGLPSLHPEEKETSFVNGLDIDPSETEDGEDFKPIEPEIIEEKEGEETEVPITVGKSESPKQKTYGDLNPEERQNYITENAPEMSEEDLLTEDGRVLDFGEALNLDQLIGMLSKEETVKNGVGQDIPSEQIIDVIYDRMANRNNPNRDWTKITLRHRLRETVYRIAEDYLESGQADLLHEKILDRTAKKIQAMPAKKSFWGNAASKVKSFFRR